jgi:hypothetical protein
VECASRGDAVEFERQLKDEGHAVIRRAHFVFVGANNEDDANQLATRIKHEAPLGAKVVTEPGGGVAWETQRDWAFSIFGGLAG